MKIGSGWHGESQRHAEAAIKGNIGAVPCSDGTEKIRVIGLKRDGSRVSSPVTLTRGSDYWGVVYDITWTSQLRPPFTAVEDEPKERELAARTGAYVLSYIGRIFPSDDGEHVKQKIELRAPTGELRRITTRQFVG